MSDDCRWEILGQKVAYPQNELAVIGLGLFCLAIVCSIWIFLHEPPGRMEETVPFFSSLKTEKTRSDSPKIEEQGASFIFRRSALGQYYVLWPAGMAPTPPPLPPGAFRPAGPIPRTPQPGDLCCLWSPLNSPQIWSEIPPTFQPLPSLLGPEVLAAQEVAVAYPRMLASGLRNMTALNQLTDCWQIFDQAENSQLKATTET